MLPSSNRETQLRMSLCRGKDVVASMIKRLAHRNANVQLYTLEVCRRHVVKAMRLTDVRWPMLFPKIAVIRYIGNFPRELLQKL